MRLVSAAKHWRREVDMSWSWIGERLGATERATRNHTRVAPSEYVAILKAARALGPRYRPKVNLSLKEENLIVPFRKAHHIDYLLSYAQTGIL